MPLKETHSFIHLSNVYYTLFIVLDTMDTKVYKAQLLSSEAYG